jgi:pimeloyl-ACP methyl ester carboxylesterase
MDKVVLAGHSRGGVLASVYAAEHPGAAVGVINFSGGWKNHDCGPVDANAALFAEAGSRSRVPSLFLYAYGDAFYSDDAMRNYGAVYKAAGGDLRFELLKVENINGHQLFHRALPVWERSVDEFLGRLRLTTASVN